MKIKKTPTQKDRSLKAYASMGAAFLAVTPQVADAQIVHFDPPDVTTTISQAPGDGPAANFLFLDINGNTTGTNSFAGADIGIYQFGYPAYTAGSDWATARNIAFGTNGGAVSASLSTNAYYYYGARKLNNGMDVCTGPGFSAYAGAGVLYNHRYWSFLGGTFNSTGAWGPNSTNVTGFLGVQFTIGANTHYGWVRVTSNVSARVPSGHANISTTIHEYAYDATPDKCIKAGDRPEPIPTLSEWGLITLSLLLLSFGTVLIGKREEILAGESTGNFNLSGSLQRPPFFAKYFKKALIGTGLLAAAMGAFSIFAYGEITMVDFFGTMVAGPIFAYLMHLMAAYNDKFKKNEVK